MNDEPAMKQQPPQERYAVWDPLAEAPVYEVPIEELSDEVAQALGYPDWCLSIREDPEESWTKRIYPDSEATPAEKHLVSEFSNYTPTAMVVCDGTAWWAAGHKDDSSGGDRFFLGPRGSFAAFGDKLCAAGFHQFHEIVRLCELLNGFRDGSPFGGRVSAPNDNLIFLTEDYVRGNFGEFSLGDDWNPSFIFFSTDCGDSLLINCAGACAWWPEGSEDLEPFADDIEACIEKWIAFRWRARLRGGIPYPFSPYERD
jgi:hypothetical protein